MDERDVQRRRRRTAPGRRWRPSRRRAPRARSSSGISAIVGPSVISRKLSEAGYLVVLRNESAAGISPVVVHGRGIAVQIEPSQEQEERDAAQADRVADPMSSCRLERQDRPNA